MTRQKQGEAHSVNYNAVYMRKKRAEMVKKDPLALRRCVWIVEIANGKQIVFKNRKDIKIQRINKRDLKSNHIKAY